MAAWRIGGSVVGGRFRSAGAWLCAAVLLAGICLAGAGVHGVRAAQQPQAAGGQQAPEPQNGGQQSGGQQSDGQQASDQQLIQQAGDQQLIQPDSPGAGSSAPQTDGADELLKEFPADPASKAATDPRDGHPANEPAYVPPPEETAPAGNGPQPAASMTPAPVAPPVLMELPTDPKQRQVAIECNDLLAMAAELKMAVDKSTKDQLSIEVLRKAGQLEQYARKVRSGAALTAGK